MKMVQTTITCWVAEVECACGAKAPHVPMPKTIEQAQASGVLHGQLVVPVGDLADMHGAAFPKGWSRAWVEIPDDEGIFTPTAVYFCSACRACAVELAERGRG